jgi:hypothetical protein
MPFNTPMKPGQKMFPKTRSAKMDVTSRLICLFGGSVSPGDAEHFCLGHRECLYAMHQMLLNKEVIFGSINHPEITRNTTSTKLGFCDKKRTWEN